MNDLNDHTEYIDAYFKNRLSDAERRQFEERCLQDAFFAGQVALFITAEEGIRQKLLQQKQVEWAGDKRKTSDQPLKKIIWMKWLPYVTAACLILAVAVYFLIRSDETPHQFADTYIKQHLTLLSQTMNASKDSMQQGIAAYNNQDYNKALQIFEKLYQSHPENSNAKKYAGLVYLVRKDYEKALQQFDELAGMKDVYSNQGMFLKAVALLQRNKQEDKAEAKQLLEQIVSEKAEGSREAEKWLKEWK